jgi:hypothetical protein
MAVLTTQKINEYYDRFKALDATFTKEVIGCTGLDKQQVQIKCGSDFFPCFVYSTSFEGARVVINLKSGILEKLQAANNIASLKFFFQVPAANETVAFFVSCTSKGYSNYNTPEQGLFTLHYKQRPPDDLIEIMGRVLEANLNFSKRHDERIVIDTDNVRKLKLADKEAALAIQGIPRRCILRELTFCGARVIIAGIPKFLLEKPVVLSLEFDDPKENIPLAGKFTGSEEVSGRQDLSVMLISFGEPIPLAYKLRISDFLGALRTESRGETKKDVPPVQAASPVKPAPETASPPAKP